MDDLPLTFWAQGLFQQNEPDSVGGHENPELELDNLAPPQSAPSRELDLAANGSKAERVRVASRSTVRKGSAQRPYSPLRQAVSLVTSRNGIIL